MDQNHCNHRFKRIDPHPNVIRLTKSPWMLLFACLPPQWPASRRPHALAADRPHSHTAVAARLVQHRGSIDSQSRSAQDSRPARPSPEYIYSGKATRKKDVSSPSECSSSRSSWGRGQSAETCSLGMSQIGSEAFTLRGTCSPPPSTPPCSPPSPSASSTRRRLYGCCSLAWHAATRIRASDGRAWWTP